MDISNAGEPVILPTARILPEARAPLPQHVGPSNRVNGVGQMARAAAQDARENGLDLPKNAQGHAASQIARGADPESVFSALVADTTPADDGAENADPAADAPEGGAVAETDDASGEEISITPTEATDSAEVIGLLLDEADGASPEQAALDLLLEGQVA